MKRHVPILILIGCLALLAFGLVELFALRFAGGDVYPAYSSLRADPLGTMAFYESLEKIPGLSVQRDFSDNDRLPEQPHTVYLQFAGSRYDWGSLPDDTFHELKDFLARGNRLVIAFAPENGWRGFDENENGGARSNKMDRAKSEKMTPEKSDKKSLTLDKEAYVSLEDKWGFHIGSEELKVANDVYEPATVIRAPDLPLPEKLDWHSSTVFTHWDTPWQIIYGRGRNAVLMERDFAHGSVVLATDCYFASNEAMEKDRHADLLAWLVGTNSNIVFDESHFGIVDAGGVATLMRQYHLHGLMAGFILLAALFIWKNATSLVPPATEEKLANFVAGKDAASGFVNLLRRNIAPRDLLAACYAEWKKTGATGKYSKARLQQVEEVFKAENQAGGNLTPGKPATGKGGDPVGTYLKISEILGSHKKI